MARTYGWRSTFDSIVEDPRLMKMLRKMGITPAKDTDLRIVWLARLDLNSVHLNEYQHRDDWRVHDAMEDARSSLKKLEQVLRNRRAEIRRKTKDRHG